MFLSVIIPVHNGGATFRRCLQALGQSRYTDWECVVVDDGSIDDSVLAARDFGARVVSTANTQSGPAWARNVGAQIARGEVLLFIDADVAVQPGTLGHVAAVMQANPGLTACFGSYDDAPLETNFLSQYRNLLHHYVHQQSSIDASTFWSGCGAIRRSVFLEMGGFNTAVYHRPSIEDIELGYRLLHAGHRIHLEKLLQVQHMKRWTPTQVLKTDIYDRAIPWTQLILQAGSLPNDLNLQTGQRLSAAALWLGIASILALPWQRTSILTLLLALVLLVWLNADFYAFLMRKRGLVFALKALPWHWLYFGYSSLAFAGCVVWYGVLRMKNPAPRLGQTAVSPFTRPHLPLEMETP